MVKIPGLDDLKKLGCEWVGSAANMVDKLKNDIEAAGMKHAVNSEEASHPVQLMKTIQEAMSKIMSVQASQAAAIDKLAEDIAILESKLSLQATEKGESK